jgi:hypothetical protein
MPDFHIKSQQCLLEPNLFNMYLFLLNPPHRLIGYYVLYPVAGDRHAIPILARFFDIIVGGLDKLPT